MSKNAENYLSCVLMFDSKPLSLILQPPYPLVEKLDDTLSAFFGYYIANC